MKKNPFGRRKVASAECELNVDHITITLQTSGCGHAMFGFRRAQLQHERGGAYWQTKALQTSRFCHQILTSSRTVRQRQNDDLRFCLPCEKCEWWGRRERAPVNILKESFADEETCRDWYRIEHAGWWLDQRVAILADQPLCSDELDDQLSSLLCQWIHQPLVVVSAAVNVCNSAGCSAEIGWIPGPGLGSLRAHVLIDKHASRARPSSAVAVFEIEYCACVKISPSVWGILGDGVSLLWKALKRNEFSKTPAAAKNPGW